MSNTSESRRSEALREEISGGINPFEEKELPLTDPDDDTVAVDTEPPPAAEDKAPDVDDDDDVDDPATQAAATLDEPPVAPAVVTSSAPAELMADIHTPLRAETVAQPPSMEAPEIDPELDTASRPNDRKGDPQMDRLVALINDIQANPTTEGDVRGAGTIARLKAYAAGMLGRRVDSPHRLRKGVVIGAALVVAAGLTSARGLELGPFGDNVPAPHEIVASPTNFSPVRDIVRAPVAHLRTVRERHGASSERASGAHAAARSLIETAFTAVTDAEARIAIAATAVEMALIAHDTEQLGLALRWLDMIPSAAGDSRAAHARAAAYSRLAEVTASSTPIVSQRWTQRARVAHRMAADISHTATTTGWNWEVAQQMERSLVTVRDEPGQGKWSAAYRAGRVEALTQAFSAFNRVVVPVHVEVAQQRGR